MAKTKNSFTLTLKEKEIMKTLSASGKTDHAIAMDMNRSPHTVKRYLQCPEARESIETIKQELVVVYENIARRMLDSITDEDIQKISAYQRVISSGIAIDKMRLLKESAPPEKVDIAYNIKKVQQIDKEMLLREAELEELLKIKFQKQLDNLPNE